jgi:sugar lactone lactonase YvrE
VLAFGNGGQTPAKPDLTVRNNSLVRIDPQGDEIVAVTPVGRGPEAAAVSGDTVWSYNWDDRTVSAVDAGTNLVEQTASISGSPPFTIGNGIAADENGAWVVSSLGGKGLLTHLRLGDYRPREFDFPWDPISVALGEGAVWVAAKDIRGSAVLKIDPASGSLLAEARLRGAVVDSGSQFRDVQWIAVGNGAVWALQGGTLFRIDPRTGRVAGRLTLPVHEPGGIAVGAGAVWVLVFHTGRNAVLRVEPRAMRVTGRTSAPRVPGSGSSANYAGNALAIGGNALWWSGGDAGVVWKLDPRTAKIASTIRLTPSVEVFGVKAPYGITAGADGVWVAVRVAP